MSHIPAKAMPHARAHHDDDDHAPKGKDKERAKHGSPGSNALPIAAFALGGLATVGAIAAAVYLGTQGVKPKPSKHKRRKPA